MVTYATIKDSRDCLEGQHEGQQIPGAGTPLDKPNRYVPPQRVGFLPILVLNWVWFSRKLRERMNVLIISIPHE